jgi:hypothetical protein
LLQPRNGGSIIFTSTFVGAGMPGTAAAPRAKPGTIGLTQVLAAELVKCLRAPLEHLEGRRDLLRPPDFEGGEVEAERAGRCLRLADLPHAEEIADRNIATLAPAELA